MATLPYESTAHPAEPMPVEQAPAEIAKLLAGWEAAEIVSTISQARYRRALERDQAARAMAHELYWRLHEFLSCRPGRKFQVGEKVISLGIRDDYNRTTFINVKQVNTTTEQ